MLGLSFAGRRTGALVDSSVRVLFVTWRAVIRARRMRTRMAAIRLFAGAFLVVAPVAGALVVSLAAVYGVYFDRGRLPDAEAFVRFDFPAVGHVFDRSGQPLLTFAKEYRHLSRFEDIPAVVRDAVLASEDKRFFSHDGVDYFSLPRVVGKIRVVGWVSHVLTGGRWRGATGPTLFPQGGSTITQQLVRGVFLGHLTSSAHRDHFEPAGWLARLLGTLVGARNVNMVSRKLEEVRLALWIEQEMGRRFGSKTRAKQEILARYMSVVYMGEGQYGFAAAAEHYFGRPLASFTVADADKAALLAGIMKAPRDYAPTSTDAVRLLRRRDQILTRMADAGAISAADLADALARPRPPVRVRAAARFESSAVIEHVLADLRRWPAGASLDDLFTGRIQVHATVDERVQRIVSDALEEGLARYEERHPRARGLVQGSVVVLRNRDGAILAESGGRRFFDGQDARYTDFNRARESIRQPGSAMKPIVYLAAFRRGGFTLETTVFDEPVSVPDGPPGVRKWIANYDGRFKGPMPLRQALAESRNAVAIRLADIVGLDRVAAAARSLGVETPLQRYVTTALGASDVTLIELATAYRTMASSIVAAPFIIQSVVDRSGRIIASASPLPAPVAVADRSIALVQEGLRGVVRLPGGTAHALSARAFPIAVMGKTGTTSNFRDALFVGSTYGADGITVAVRIGFDDGRSLGSNETGGRVAMPVFRDVMLRVYRDLLAGPVPAFPSAMEARITRYLRCDPGRTDRDEGGPARCL